jgi:tRNA1Val (adenine37-N6)-methyltransferase
MHGTVFRFKQFTIHQERCAMKVGTDGVLLGAWASLEGVTSLLDVGTGTGLVALMAAQRAPGATVHAVEIDPAACSQARENIARCPWASRVTLFEGPVQQFIPPLPYDTILCNPPYFTRSTPSPDAARGIARHCETLAREELLDVAGRAMAPGGSLQVILPVDEGERFVALAAGRGWHLARLTTVRPTPGKPPKRVLLRLAREVAPAPRDEIVLEIARHARHESHRALTRDFYLDA